MPYNLKVRAYKPFIPVEARQEYLDIVDEILREGMLSGGRYTVEAERMLASRTGMKHAVLVCSGGAAYDLIMRYYWYERNKRYVFMQALGFHGMYSIAKYIGYHVVFVDTEKDRFIIDTGKLEEAIRGKEDKAVVLVTDLFGYHYPDVDEELDQLAVDTVYDAAHALGSIGTEQTFFVSFHGGKIIGCGEGGAILTNDDDLAEYARLARVYGMVGRRPVIRGHSYCIPEICAALIYVLLKYLDFNMLSGRRVVERYKEKISDMYENMLDEKNYQYRHNGFQAVLLTKSYAEAQALRMILYEEYGIQEWGTAARYIPGEPVVASTESSTCVNALRQSMRHVLLPSGAWLDSEPSTQKYIIDAVTETLGKLRADTDG